MERRIFEQRLDKVLEIMDGISIAEDVSIKMKMSYSYIMEYMRELLSRGLISRLVMYDCGDFVRKDSDYFTKRNHRRTNKKRNPFVFYYDNKNLDKVATRLMEIFDFGAESLERRFELTGVMRRNLPEDIYGAILNKLPENYNNNSSKIISSP